jgi:hypothetical protein
MDSSLLFWNRLEPLPQTNDLSHALRCEVRDALWMLGRQWQMGEFRAEDAGTCAFVKAGTTTFTAQKLSLRGNAPQDCSPETPLNFLTEGIAPLERQAPLEGVTPELSLDLRVELGRYWMRLLQAKLPPAKATAAIKAFKAISLLHFKLPAAESTAEQVVHAPALANQPYAQMLSALSNGRAIDGWQLFQHLQAHTASSLLPHVDVLVDQSGEDFKQWVTDTFPALAKNAVSAWNSSRLEYQFDCGASLITNATEILRVPEYDGSALDWYSFNLGPEGTSPPHPGLSSAVGEVQPARHVKTVLPRLVSFAGAPRNRWWEMEDSTIDLANLRPTAADTAQFVLAEFALLFSNDWLVFPLESPVGSLIGIANLLVTDVFGDVSMIRETEQTKDWGLFSMAGEQGPPLWVPPVATTLVQAPPKAEVLLVRDELANLAWGIENVVPDGLGGGMDGLDASITLRRWLETLLRVDVVEDGEPVETTPAPVADRKYVLGTTVPENWIPFIPVRFNDNGQMNLRRAALPRTIAERAPVRIRPRTQLLRDGLESSPVRFFDLNEEEITMPGIVVREYWRQARWFDGRIFTWLAREKAYARPTRASGLRFDSVESVDK